MTSLAEIRARWENWEPARNADIAYLLDLLTPERVGAAIDHWWNFDDETRQRRTYHAPTLDIDPEMVASAILAALEGAGE